MNTTFMIIAQIGFILWFLVGYRVGRKNRTFFSCTDTPSDVVSQTHALKLQALGFKLHKAVSKEEFESPTFYQVWEWFREKHGLHATIDLHRGYGNPLTQNYSWKIETFLGLNFTMGVEWVRVDEHHSRATALTHRQAEIACLNMMISIVDKSVKTSKNTA